MQNFQDIRFDDERVMRALSAVQAAAGVCIAVQRDLVTAQTLEKRDRSPVTIADFASQAVICAMLADIGVSVVGEEDAAMLREPGNRAQLDAVTARVGQAIGKPIDPDRVIALIDQAGQAPATGTYWTLDPIDGTKGFLRGEQYAVALALIENGTVKAGILACPNFEGPNGQPGAIFAAVAGHGTTVWPLAGDPGVGGQPVKVNQARDLQQARFCESVESGHSDQSQSQRIADRLGIAQPPVRMDSQAKYAAVASGLACIYLRLPTRADYREKIWDHAAGALIIEQAGGRITDIDGKTLDFTHGRELTNNRGIVATNGPIHDAVLEAVHAVLS